jgi:hypothetical protein
MHRAGAICRNEVVVALKLDLTELLSAFPDIALPVVNPYKDLLEEIDRTVVLGKTTWCERMLCQTLLRPTSKKLQERCLGFTATLSNDAARDWKELVHSEVCTLTQDVINDPATASVALVAALAKAK